MELLRTIQEALQDVYTRRQRFMVPGFLTVSVAFLAYGVLFAPPRQFPEGSYIRVAEGTTAAEVANIFKDRSIIRSSTVFEVIVRLYGDRNITAGEYYFGSPQSVWTITKRLVRGVYDVEPVKITIPEGTSAFGIARMLRDVPDFDAVTFYELAVQKEGRLFPDTYYISPGMEPEAVVRMMENNFNAQVGKAHVAIRIAAFGKPFNEVLVMASLLEKEANNSQDRRIIAGILWNRIKNDMPLQVDATFPYIIGKNSYTITREELKTDSPYNTYVHKGLPPGPITNPGIDAILDAVTPIQTDYVYYLSDQNGEMHYSVTYEQHLKNKARYIGG